MFSKDNFRLLRLPFSIFLLPVYFFALSQLTHIDWNIAIQIGIILHFLIYPASNGYNSYMDQDTESIGGLEYPPMATRQLFYLTMILDMTGLVWASSISLSFALLLCIYILASRAYSYSGIRIKKYPFGSFLTVAFFQGAFVYFMVFFTLGGFEHTAFYTQLPALLASSCLIGAAYPLTQIYQHKQDFEAGDTTLSMVLGYRGTFVFTAFIFALAQFSLYLHFEPNKMHHFMLVSLFMLAPLLYFVNWGSKVWRDHYYADFSHTMRMNIISSAALNGCFLTLLIMSVL